MGPTVPRGRQHVLHELSRVWMVRWAVQQRRREGLCSPREAGEAARLLGPGALHHLHLHAGRRPLAHQRMWAASGKAEALREAEL